MLTKHLSKLDPRRSVAKSPRSVVSAAPVGDAVIDPTGSEPVVEVPPPKHRGSSDTERTLAGRVESLSDQVKRLAGRIGHVDRLEARVDLLQGRLDVDRAVATTRPARTGRPRFDDLALPIPDELAARLDKVDLAERTLDGDELAFRRDGFLVKEGLIPEELTAAYLADRLAMDEQDPKFSVWGGSYMGIPSMRDVCLYPELVELVEKLIGVPLALFLSLSGLKSSRREWHQDFYLKPGYENVHYLAVWIALGDIDPDSGPYEFVPGSHRLPTLRNELVEEWLQPEERVAVGAPRIAERFVTAACNELIAERELEVRQFVPKRGDVLVWHHSLLHQGSRPNNPNLLRPGVIAHFNAVSTLEANHKGIKRHPGGGAYVVRTDQAAVMAGRTAGQALVDAAKRQQLEQAASRAG
jgi:hypothetical protein